MLKQRLTNLPPILSALRVLVLDQLGRPETARCDVTRVLPRSADHTGHMVPRYWLETDGHVTPSFLIKDDVIEVEHVEDFGSIALMDLDDAAEWLARELAEVA
jgi:hypothetical protein